RLWTKSNSKKIGKTIAVVYCVKNISTAEQFCHDILNSNIKRAKALVNIVMSLGSETTARNPTHLSLSPFFQYHYSITGKVMKELGEDLNAADSLKLKSELHQVFFEKMPLQSEYKLSTDFTTIRKPESPTLEGRGFVNIPNVRIYGNKPIDIGYYISCLNLHLYDASHPIPWSIPLDNQRVDVQADKISVAVQQLSDLLSDKNLPFAQSEKIVNTADTGYTVPEFISPLIDKFDNMLLINRIRYGMKVYKPYTGKQKKTGRKKEYESDPYYLQTERERMFTHPKTKERFSKAQRPIFDLKVDETVIYETTLAKGRKIIVHIDRWNDILLHGKNDYKMDDKPFDLTCIRFIDKQTGAYLFKREMFVGVWGKNRRTHTTLETQTDYKHRYDIEPHNRFSKQQLLADKYQTSDVQSLDAWLWTVLLTFWLLYFSSTDTEVCVQPWEKYLPEVKRASQSGERKSAAMTRKGAKTLFSTFDTRPFKPQESKNGRGRKKGTVLTKKPRWTPKRKIKNEQNCKQNIEQIK
ncbi:MAG: hypothetical protein AB8B69_11025, partial [Chitinophagales bacterium]